MGAPAVAQWSPVMLEGKKILIPILEILDIEILAQRGYFCPLTSLVVTRNLWLILLSKT
jgi:hypothetical protein